MIEKRIEICIGTDRSKHVRARLSLLLIDTDTGKPIFEHYHSINITPGADLAALRAENEAHLAKTDGTIPGQPWPAIPDSEWEKVEKCCAVVHTPDVLLKTSTEQDALILDIQKKKAIIEAEKAALEQSKKTN